MKKNKVLFLGISAVQKDAIEVLKKMDVEVHAVAKDNIGPGKDYADHFVKIDILDKEKLEKYILENDINFVYSTGSDISMPVIANLSEKLKLKSFISESTAKICNNKDLMRKVLGKDFEGNINSLTLEHLSECNEVVVNKTKIMKPSDSQGQRGIFLINSKKDIIDNFENSKSFSRNGKVIIEDYIGGKEYSVNGYLIDGKLVFTEISLRETWEEHPGLIRKHILKCDEGDSAQNKVKSLLARTCEKIQISNGPVYAQVKVEDGKPYLIEITPRLDGCHMWRLIEYKYDINLMHLTLSHLIYNDFNFENKIPSLNINDKEIWELEFVCQKPETKFEDEKFDLLLDNSNVLYSEKYYKNNEVIKKVNGRNEKIGFVIRKVKEEIL